MNGLDNRCGRFVIFSPMLHRLSSGRHGCDNSKAGQNYANDVNSKMYPREEAPFLRRSRLN
jgi:hypothetical protein